MSARRRGADIVRGLGALVGLVALLVGVPYLLWLIGGSPIPTSIPSLDDVVDTLSRRDNGRLFVEALVFVGWLGWLTFAVSVVVEIPAALRGVRAPRLPALGLQQRVAAGIVAAVSAMLAIGPVASAGTAAAVDAPTSSTTSNSSDAFEAEPPVTTEDVKPAAPAAATEAASEAAAAGEPYVVERGDTLWDISGEHLGDPTRYPEIVDASDDTVQSDGRRLTDPDLIMPGWTLTIPGATAAPTDAPHTQEQAPAGPPVDEPADPPVEAEKPAPAGVAKPTITSSAEVPETRDSVQAPADVEEAGDEADTSVVRTVGGVGAMLAAGVVAYLARRRAIQQRRRRSGQRIPVPADDAIAAEVELRHVADSVGRDFVDRALRTLTARLAEQGQALPPLMVARLAREQFELYLAEPAELPAPFTQTANPGVWTLLPGADGVLGAEEAAQYPSPFPSLVTIGHDPEDAHLMVDLEQLGTLGVDGADETVGAFMTALAAEYATSVWADDIRVTLVGAHPDLEALDTGRVRHVTRVEQLLVELETRADEDRQLLQEAGSESLGQARAGQVAEETWTPEIVLVSSQLSEEHRRRLAELVSSMPRVAIASVTSSAPDGAWMVQLGQGDSALLQPVGMTIRPQLLDEEGYGRILELFAVANEEPVGDPGSELALADIPAPSAPEATAEPLIDSQPQVTGPSEPSPAAPGTQTTGSPRPPRGEVDSGATAAGSLPSIPPAPRILMLGQVGIEGALGQVDSSKRHLLTEMAIYLALRPGRHRDDLQEALWPGRRDVENTRKTAVSKLRRWLGVDPTGSPYLPRVIENYALASAVRSDWGDWQELITDPAAAATADLRAALELVRGRPLSGGGPRKYPWAEFHVQEMIAVIVDTAHELAQRSLAAGDPRTAVWATELVLEFTPGVELLWRDRLKAEAVVGRADSVSELIDQMRDVVDELGGDLDPETEALVDQLTRRSSARSAAS